MFSTPFKVCLLPFGSVHVTSINGVYPVIYAETQKILMTIYLLQRCFIYNLFNIKIKEGHIIHNLPFEYQYI